MTHPLAALIRTIPDYPAPGILFRDVTTLLRDPAGFGEVVELMVGHARGRGVSLVAGIEARGFILGGAVAHGLGVGFVPIRKPGKLPAPTFAREYQLEYGTDQLEIHRDAVVPGDRALLVDDLIATGGTALAAIALLRTAGADVVAASFVMDLPDLGGAARVRAAEVPVHAIMDFEGH